MSKILTEVALGVMNFTVESADVRCIVNVLNVLCSRMLSSRIVMLAHFTVSGRETVLLLRRYLLMLAGSLGNTS